MERRSLALVATIVFLLQMNFCGMAVASPSPALKKFEQMCLKGHDNCIFARIRFESSHSALKEVHVYRRLESQSDVDLYKKWINDILAPGKLRGVKDFTVQRYSSDLHAWINLPSTKACQYCVESSKLLAEQPEWLRAKLLQDISADQSSFLAFGDVVRKGEKLRIQITVTAPSYVNPKDQSPIYIDSRIKGRHATTSFTKGGVVLRLSGNEVPWNFPDYVAISPVKSWSDIAEKYRERETTLLKGAAGLPGSPEGTPEQRLDRMAHQLHAYQIHYDAWVGGVFPSLTPDQVIANRRGDCKALTTVADGLLQRSGVPAHIVMLGDSSLPPLSFSVPDAFWNPLHVILYLPSIDLYIDPTRIASGAAWKTSADAYVGAIALDMTTGSFVVIH